MSHNCIHYNVIGVSKKLEAAAKEKGCQLIKEWQQSIVNHLYWSAASTDIGNGKVVRAKWESLMNHVVNRHTDHGPIFSHCEHPPIPVEQQRRWFIPCKSKHVINCILHKSLNCNFMKSHWYFILLIFGMLYFCIQALFTMYFLLFKWNSTAHWILCIISLLVV